MPRVKQVKAAKDYPKEGIVKGDVIYRWKLRHGPPMMSKTYPKRSQLTSSEFLQWLYDLQDEMGGKSELDEDARDSLVSDLQEKQSELEERLSNMPEGLQAGSSGQIIQDRIDALESAASELESLSYDYEQVEWSEILAELMGMALMGDETMMAVMTSFSDAEGAEENGDAALFMKVIQDRMRAGNENMSDREVEEAARDVFNGYVEEAINRVNYQVALEQVEGIE